MTVFRVPLVLETSLAVIYRLDPAGTQNVQIQTSTPTTSGYDEIFREPIAYTDQQLDEPVRDEGRVELPPIKVPCQFETLTHEELRQLPAGVSPNTRMILVFHRMDLTALKLLDSRGRVYINRNDRVSHLESRLTPGKITVPFEDEGYYINQFMPDSAGFGPDGFDLYLAYLTEREEGQG